VLVYAFLTTPTLAGRSTRPLSINPFCWVWKQMPSSLSGCGAWNTASCTLGLNFSPLSLGSNRSNPCFFSVLIKMLSVILMPSCRAMRSALPSAAFNLSAGTVPRARSRLSTDSTKSRAKRWMAKSFAPWISRFVRSCRLRKSATERRYLSCAIVRLDAHTWSYLQHSTKVHFWV
jgi:hypothetical protein